MKIKVLLENGAEVPKYGEKVKFTTIGEQFTLYNSRYDTIARVNMTLLSQLNSPHYYGEALSFEEEIKCRIAEGYQNGFAVGINNQGTLKYLTVELDKILLDDTIAQESIDDIMAQESNIYIMPQFTIDDRSDYIVTPPMNEEVELYDTRYQFSELGDLIEELLLARENDRMDDDTVLENKREETRGMDMKNDMFGKITGDQFKLSINGLAVKGSDNKYYTYNSETRELVEVTNGFFDGMNDMLYMMPATSLEVGDIVLHQNKPYYISRVSNGMVSGIDFTESIETTLIGKTNVFGMKYFTKVFNAFGTNDILSGMENPMMLYALMGNGSNDISKIMLMQALSKSNDNSNPMTAMAMASAMGTDGGSGMEYMALQQMLQNQTNAKTAATKKETAK